MTHEHPTTPPPAALPVADRTTAPTARLPVDDVGDALRAKGAAEVLRARLADAETHARDLVAALTIGGRVELWRRWDAGDRGEARERAHAMGCGCGLCERGIESMGGRAMNGGEGR